METVGLEITSPVVGYVDRVQPGKIGGWLMNSERPLQRCTVLARYQGRIVAEAVAESFRDDLQSQGYGDGRYGFVLSIPSRLKAGEIDVIESVSGAHLSGSPVRLGSDELEREKRTNGVSNLPFLLLDVSDLIRHLERHDQLSGIQRVQANVLCAILDDALLPLNRIRTVYYSDNEQAFYEVPLAFISSVIEDLRNEPANREFRRHDDGRLHLLEQAAMRPVLLNDQEATNAVLLMLGTVAWEFPAYFQALRQLKRRGAKFIPLFYDLIPLTMPYTCGPGVPEAFKGLLHRSLSNADHVLALSEHTRRDLLAYCAEHNVECPPTSVTKTAQSLKATPNALKAAAPIDGDYVLFVSTIEGRKNHSLVLRVWERLKAEYGDGIPTLVLVGRVGWRVDDVMGRLYESNFLGGKVVMLCDVSDETLAALYNHCLFSVFPSLYEGWGLPVGESLSFGKVCLASNAASIPEAGGDFAVYFDPNSLEDALEKTKRLIFDSAWRSDLEGRISADFKPITWTDVALNILNGSTSCAEKSRVSAPPLLDVGEYSFANIAVLQSRTNAGESTSYLRECWRPIMSRKALTLDHYIGAEFCITEGGVFAPEEWGRWGHREGNTLEFRTPNTGKAYLAILKVAVPGSFLPATLEISGPRGIDRVCKIASATAFVRVDTERFMVGGAVRIRLKLTQSATVSVEGDPRQLGIGFCRLAIIEDTLSERLELLERLAYV